MTPVPHVVVAPAMGAPAAFYRPLVEAFAARGWTADTLPAPGVDRGTAPPSRRHDWGYPALVDRLDQRVRAVRAQDPGRPVLVLGHSLGGQAAVVWADGGGGPDGLVLVAAPVPWFGYYRFGAIGLLGLAVPVLTRVVGHWPAGLFAGAQPATLMRQWAGFVRTGRLPVHGTRARGQLASPALVVSLEGDPYATTPATAALGRFTRPDRVTSWTLTRAEAGDRAVVDHLRWVKRPGLVVDRVVRWWESA